MEAYAATVAYSDHETGRVIEVLRDSGQYNNTMIVFIEGDNGASAEGGLQGLAFPIIRYHPAIIAQAAATMAIMSDNRFSLAVGPGSG